MLTLIHPALARTARPRPRSRAPAPARGRNLTADPPEAHLAPALSGSLDLCVVLGEKRLTGRIWVTP